MVTVAADDWEVSFEVFTCSNVMLLQSAIPELLIEKVIVNCNCNGRLIRNRGMIGQRMMDLTKNGGGGKLLFVFITRVNYMTY